MHVNVLQLVLVRALRSLDAVICSALRMQQGPTRCVSIRPHRVGLHESGACFWRGVLRSHWSVLSFALISAPFNAFVLCRHVMKMLRKIVLRLLNVWALMVCSDFLS